MSNFQKLVTGKPTGTQVQGTDVGSGAATSSQFLAASGGSASAFRSLAAGDLPTITLTSDVTGSGSGGSVSTTVSAIQGTSVTGVTGTGKVVFQTSPTVNGATISGSGTTIQTFALFVDVSDATKKLQISTSGNSTNTQLTLSSNQTTNQNISIPNITGSDTLATLGLAQTFSAVKTFSSAPILSSLAAHGILISENTSAIVALVGGTGTLLTGQGSSVDPSFSATPTLGVNGTTAGTLALATSTVSGGSVTIQNPSTTSGNAYNFNLPATVGSAGQVLTSQGGGATAMTWTAHPTLTSLGIFSGKNSIGSAATSVSVTFSTAFANTSYSITANFINITDTNPQYQPINITAQSTTGFTASWNAPTSTTNYVLSWQAITDN